MFKAIAVWLYLVMTVLLTFLKLMRNAVGGRSVLWRALKVGADVPQWNSVAFCNLQKR